MNRPKKKTWKRPLLTSVPLPESFLPGKCYITCSPGQWDALLAASYERGSMLLEIEEINGEEKAVRAYQKQSNN
jgi:hypothetical protein